MALVTVMVKSIMGSGDNHDWNLSQPRSAITIDRKMVQPQVDTCSGS
jgi:hypothetical protein